jgi:flagellar protein FliO/FliZ
MSLIQIFSGFLPLFLIIIALGGILYLVKKFGYKFKLKNVSAFKIQIVATKMIMPKKYITVVNVQDNLLVLGISEHSITLLKEISENIPTETDSFSEILKKNIGLK